MEDPIDRGYPFDIHDFWKAPWTDDDASQHDSLFESLAPVLPTLEPSNIDGFTPFELDAIIPELEHHGEGPLPRNDEIEGDGLSAHAISEEDTSEDSWNFVGNLHDDDISRLCTWEGLGKRGVSSPEGTALISESGPAAFDAAINLLPELRNDVGVLPQDYALRALCSLALGRSSTLFRWNQKTECFEQTLKGASVTGFSQLCSASLAVGVVELGSTIAKLRTSLTRQRLSKRPSASLALQSCSSSILSAIDESLSGQFGSIRSVLQLQNLLATPRRLISVLDALIESTRQCESDESVISSISDRIYEEVQTQYDLCPVLRALLARVSVPWLERLATDIGLCSTETALVLGYSIGNEDMEDLVKAITFVDADDKDLIRGTKHAIRILRTQDEYHPLLRCDQQAFSAFINPTLSGEEVSSISKRYRQAMVDRLRTGQRDDISYTGEMLSGQPEEGSTWRHESSQLDVFEQTAALMTSPDVLRPDHTVDTLHEEVMSLCCSPNSGSSPAFVELATDLSTTPLERIRPLIQTQQRLVNGILLRRLFREHDLRHRLEVQRSFQLFGNADFVLRLSTALFNPETQSAERKRGATLTGEVMGLRLGTTHEERWPPASSELQLALMSILNETYSKVSRKEATKSTNGTALPGGLSFAIRQLPESEIDRVLDPNSVYALDFLRLQYASVPPLDTIITSDALEKYDGMFRFLLRLLRVVHVTANLQKALSLNWEVGRPDIEACNFIRQADHFVCVLMSHTMDLGIAEPWRFFMRSIDDLSKVLAQEDDAGEIGTKANIGIEGLRRLHDQCLDSIRSRLFLKRRQSKLRLAVEEALNAILKASFALQRNDAQVRAIFRDGRSSFSQSTKQIVRLLQEQVDKPLKTVNASEVEDVEMNKILLARLNWNEYYT